MLRILRNWRLFIELSDVRDPRNPLHNLHNLYNPPSVNVYNKLQLRRDEEQWQIYYDRRNHV